MQCEYEDIQVCRECTSAYEARPSNGECPACGARDSFEQMPGGYSFFSVCEKDHFALPIVRDLEIPLDSWSWKSNQIRRL